MNLSIQYVSYLSSAVTFCFLGMLLVANLKRQYRVVLLTLACFITSIWGGVNAFSEFKPDMVFSIDAMEIIRSLIWLAFIGNVLIESKNGINKFHLNSIEIGVIALSVVLLMVAAYVHSKPFDHDSVLPVIDLFGHVAMAIIGMVLIEQLFRNTHPDSRWGIKFLCLGIGVIFAYDFFMYSDAMLFHRINPDLWMARGMVNAISAPLIMVSAARNPQWSLRIHTSRRVVFHTMSLFGSGVYLLVMASAGYYIRIFGGNWGAVLQIAFFAGATILLLVIFFSGSIRSKLKVMLSKHFFSYKYDYREEWLKFTSTLLTVESNEQSYMAAIRAIAALVESPGGALWMEKESGDAYTCVAQLNMRVPGMILPVDDSMILFMKRSQWVINIDEYQPNRDLYGDLEIPDWILELESIWLVVPLMLYDRLLGFIMLAQPRSEIHFNWEVSDLLKAAGYQIANNLAQKRATEALLVAKQFDSFNRMSAFVVHDLKNLVAQLSLMLSNAEKHRDNPDFQEDMLSTVENSVSRMNQLLSQLRSGSRIEGGNDAVELEGLLRKVFSDKSALKPSPVLKVNANVVVDADRERLARVMGHIIQNACEATNYGGRVEVRLERSDNFAVIEVEDNGHGMDESFVRERLFRPFDSTKRTGMGIGAHECREYILELGGDIEVKSEPSKGTLFRVTIPFSNLMSTVS